MNGRGTLAATVDRTCAVLFHVSRMRSIKEIWEMLSDGQYNLSRHAFRRMVERNISDETIRQAGAMAEIIEDYPDDKYSPSCLLLGFTPDSTRYTSRCHGHLILP